MPVITSLNGTRFRQAILDEHVKKLYHIECLKADKIKSLTEPTMKLAPMDKMISKANEDLANYIGKLCINIYNDAKRLNLSAWSWPSRYVANEVANSFNFNCSEQQTSIIPPKLNLKYINPPSHLEILNCIVASDQNNFKEKIKNSIAISIRADGSVDRTQIDKIYVMAKIVNSDGSIETVILGIAEQSERGALGLFNAVLSAIKVNLDTDGLEIVLKKVSSICTDGTNVNTGERNGLWTLFEKKVEDVGSEIPITKIWCAVHRSELAWKHVSSKVPIISKLFSILSSISSYFNTSGIRTSRLKQISQDNNLNILKLPKLFEIRWTEFTFDLLHSIMVSWHALVLYFKENEYADRQSSGFLRFLVKIEKLKLLAFLADVLFIYHRFQKKLQNNNLTLISMESHVKTVSSSLTNLIDNQLPGGYEETLANSITKNADDKIYLKGVELTIDHRSEDFNATRKNILTTLHKFLRNRFSAEEDFLSVIKPFVSLDSSADVSKVHKLIGKDLNLAQLFLQYNELCQIAETNDFKTYNLIDLMKKLAVTQSIHRDFKELFIILARISVCTPHSADVERAISANNLLKTTARQNLALKTENKYMYISINMPDLALWNPRKAVILWIQKKDRYNTDKLVGEQTKALAQEYYRGVFTEAKRNEEEKERKCNEAIKTFKF